VLRAFNRLVISIVLYQTRKKSMANKTFGFIQKQASGRTTESTMKQTTITKVLKQIKLHSQVNQTITMIFLAGRKKIFFKIDFFCFHLHEFLPRLTCKISNAANK